MAKRLHYPRQDTETTLIVYALLAAILMLVGVTAASSLDLSNHKRR